MPAVVKQPPATSVVGKRIAAGVADAFLTLVLYKAMRGVFHLGMFRTIEIMGAYIFAHFVVIQGFQGLTLGKVVMGVKLVDARGRPPGALPALIRTAAFAVDMWFLGIALIMSSADNRRLGDAIAGTYVMADIDGKPTDPLPVEDASAATGPRPKLGRKKAAGTEPGAAEDGSSRRRFKGLGRRGDQAAPPPESAASGAAGATDVAHAPSGTHGSTSASPAAGANTIPLPGVDPTATPAAPGSGEPLDARGVEAQGDAAPDPDLPVFAPPSGEPLSSDAPPADPDPVPAGDSGAAGQAAAGTLAVIEAEEVELESFSRTGAVRITDERAAEATVAWLDEIISKELPVAGPEWDEARGAYVQWDPVNGRMMQYDYDAGEWSPAI
ncbi:MAG: RDD family protein [Acidimicrobiia bacterium]|nr:RDD family protein [Acidimicrobiia bacterium]